MTDPVIDLMRSWSGVALLVTLGFLGAMIVLLMLKWTLSLVAGLMDRNEPEDEVILPAPRVPPGQSPSNPDDDSPPF